MTAAHGSATVTRYIIVTNVTVSGQFEVPGSAAGPETAARCMVLWPTTLPRALATTAVETYGQGRRAQFGKGAVMSLELP